MLSRAAATHNYQTGSASDAGSSLARQRQGPGRSPRRPPPRAPSIGSGNTRPPDLQARPEGKSTERPSRRVDGKPIKFAPLTEVPPGHGAPESKPGRRGPPRHKLFRAGRSRRNGPLPEPPPRSTHKSGKTLG